MKANAADDRPDLIGLLRAEAATTVEPRASALRALVDFIEDRADADPELARVHDPSLLVAYPEVRAIVEGYGHAGGGGETSFVDAVIKTINRPDPIEQFAARPRWSVLTLWTYAFALFREQRIRCPHCAERIRREASVCRYCGHEVSPRP